MKLSLGLHLENKVVLPVSPVPPPLAWDLGGGGYTDSIELSKW